VQWILGALAAACAVAMALGQPDDYPQAVYFQRAIGICCLVAAALRLRRATR
jgi:hypothetical protein